MYTYIDNTKILFVEDELMYSKMAFDMLTRLGYNVTVKNNSLEALEVFKADPYLFDLIITDQIMPNLSGEKLSQQVHAVRPEMPIILCTGFSSQMDAQKASELKIEFVYKPITMKEISYLIRKALGSKRDTKALT